MVRGRGGEDVGGRGGERGIQPLFFGSEYAVWFGMTIAKLGCGYWVTQYENERKEKERAAAGRGAGR